MHYNKTSFKSVHMLKNNNTKVVQLDKIRLKKIAKEGDFETENWTLE